MAAGLVLIANEHRSEREAIGFALKELRPEVEVLIVDPSELLETISKKAPILVILSRLEALLPVSLPSWMILPPEGANIALISMTGQEVRIEPAGLTQIIAIVDEAVRIQKMT